MIEKQKNTFLPNELITYVLLFVIIISCFLFFAPRISSTLFPLKRTIVLNSFLQQVQQSRTISPQNFWEFREFYSPGSYIYDKNGLSNTQLQNIQNTLGVTIEPTARDLPFLAFSSPHLMSLEALVSGDSLATTVKIPALKTFLVQLSNKNEEIFRDEKGNTYIVFLKPISAMKTANGFLNYANDDLKLVTGKYWLDITMLYGK